MDRHHEPENTRCACGFALKRISEKLDNTPGVFTVECHIRGKWTCAQAPVPAEIIAKGIPTSGLLT